MAQQKPIRVVVEKKGGCFSGCGTALAVLLLIGIAIKFWYVSVGLLVVGVAVGLTANAQQKQQKRNADEVARRKPGPRDPWLNEVAVALAELDLSEVARNTGHQLGGAPLEGDIGLQSDWILLYVNLFANAELARQAEIGLRAQHNIRGAVSNGQTALKAVGPILYVASARGGVIDEFRLEEVVHAAGAIPLPPALGVATPDAVKAPSPQQAQVHRDNPLTLPGSDAIEQIRRLAQLRDAGVLTDAEFEAKKAELLRRV